VFPWRSNPNGLALPDSFPHGSALDPCADANPIADTFRYPIPHRYPESNTFFGSDGDSRAKCEPNPNAHGTDAFRNREPISIPDRVADDSGDCDTFSIRFAFGHHRAQQFADNTAAQPDARAILISLGRH
jgi:hypothetical protein